MVSIPAGIAVIATGCTLFVLFCVTIPVGIRIGNARFGRMKQAIAAESMKYVSRQPVPTRWELDSVTVESYTSDSPMSIIVFFVSILLSLIPVIHCDTVLWLSSQI